MVLKRNLSLLSVALTGILLLNPVALLAEPVPVHYVEGTVRGFLILRTLDGQELATGDLIQVLEKGRVVTHVVFHFKDGSIDDETTVFSQRGSFRLLSDHHMQQGPSFPHPMDISIDATTGQVTVRSTDDGKEKVETDQLDLPPDLANGLTLTILKNIQPNTPETKVSFLAATPKPRLVKLSISPGGKEVFSAGGAPHSAMRFVVKIELGGIAGVVAPVLGKQPKDAYVWILGGKAPAFVKMEGQFYEGGPVWRIEQTSPTFTRH